MRLGKKLITLADMIKSDESALICDLAETYHIYDYRSLPVKTVATLAVGLRDTSRISMSTTEAKASTTNTILAIIADGINAIRTLLGDKPVPSVLASLYGFEQEKQGKVKSFASSEDFITTWNEINKE